jgi:hypothetical protein
VPSTIFETLTQSSRSAERPAVAPDLLTSDVDAAFPEEDAGLLTPAARDAAIAASLTLLGTYFSSGAHFQLSTRESVAKGPPSGPDDDLALALRLRVALAAAKRLREYLRHVLRRPNFRYRLVPLDVVGVVTGQIDAEKYTRRLATREVPFSYPTLTIERGALTPENVLTTYAVTWIERELRFLTSRLVLPAKGAERRQVDEVLSDLRRIQSVPMFAICAPSVREVFRRRSERSLVASVERRLSGGHVADPRAYREVTAWLRGCLEGLPVAEPGEIEWDFYDDRFDTKLFEIWCLSKLANAISSAVGLEVAPPNLLRTSGQPAYRWATAVGVLELFFQKALTTVDSDRAAQWRQAGGSGALQGIPDLILRGKTLGDVQTLAIIDPKLRQRSSVPAEELYKILGYFLNFGLGNAGIGAVVLYSQKSSALPIYRYETEAGGDLLAVMLNPAGSVAANEEGISALAGLALRTLDIDVQALPAPESGSAGVTDEDALVVRRRQSALAMLASVAEHLGAAGLQPWLNQVQGHFPDDVWNEMSKDQQDMMATALHVGQSLGSDADFSGPVIGLCAAAESILSDRLIDPVKAKAGTAYPSGWHSLGHFVRILLEAVGSGTHPVCQEARTVLTDNGCDLVALSPIADLLATMNADYRRAAAHRTLVPRKGWVDLYRLMFVNSPPLLPSLAQTLRYSSS